ncbi:MAG: potassium-transporting ATPase subunit KdpA [Gemmatimonadota bacterium]|nr:potassium-transporting ATPase subunit KdpA [Gemmatimonadota bacterium]
MTVIGWMQIAFYAALLLAITKPLGWYLLRVYDGSMHWLSWIERPLYRLGGVDPTDDQHWTRYAASLLLFSAAGMLLTYFVLRLQALLPLNPQHLAGVTARQAFETSASFATNTNWQSYAGETTMSYLVQATQLTLHNFVSAAAGMAAAIALTRGIARHGGEAGGRLGNFWADLVRGTLYVLLPLSLVVALVLVQQGVIQNLAPYRVVTTLEGARQTIAMGPAASQIAIKQVGTNGGGFFNANSSHPFENPTPWSDFVEMFLILAIPSALTWTFGRMVKRQAHGWALWAAMFAIFAGGVSATYWAEARGNPIQAAAGVDVRPSAGNPGGNMEGKEVRFGIANSALWAVATTDASSGSVNAMHDSFTPLGGLVPLVNIQLGEEIFGGVGSGLYGMIMMAILTVFIAGLMVGRTPEYLGKKIQAREVQMVMLYALVLPAAILVPSAVSVLVKPGLAGLTNTGPHGLSEILYAFTSTVGNNGSAFAGLNGSSSYYNTLFGFAMLVGRFAMMVPVLAVGGFLAGRKPARESAGTFPVTTPLFVALLVAVILVVGALTFFPALSLGPIVEHLLMGAGRTF